MGGEIVAFGELGFACLAAAQQSTFMYEVWASGSMNRAIHAPSSKKGGVRRIDDSVYLQSRDVCLDGFHDRVLDDDPVFDDESSVAILGE